VISRSSIRSRALNLFPLGVGASGCIVRRRGAFRRPTVGATDQGNDAITGINRVLELFQQRSAVLLEILLYHHFCTHRCQIAAQGIATCLELFSHSGEKNPLDVLRQDRELGGSVDGEAHDRHYRHAHIAGLSG